jgi:hypothetical protein
MRRPRTGASEAEAAGKPRVVSEPKKSSLGNPYLIEMFERVSFIPEKSKVFLVLPSLFGQLVYLPNHVQILTGSLESSCWCTSRIV